MAGERRRGGLLGLDVPSLLVAPLGLAVVAWAQTFNGLSVHALLNVPAALVVFGGTLGAVLISYSPSALLSACREAWRAMRVDEDDVDGLAATLVAMSVRAHRYGVMSIESDVDSMGDPFLRDGLALAVDNAEPEIVEAFLQSEQAARADAEEAPARIFEAAAGYAPTLGILGAVLGLIRVMEDLGSHPGLGGGIASAFVATAYGVGIANLVLLPIAGRLRERAARAARRRELIAHGVCAIHKRLNPRLVAQGLKAASGGRSHVEDAPAVPAPRGARGLRLPRVRVSSVPS